MPKSVRNSFAAGVLDPKLASRSDIEQYRFGLRQGTNFMLMPHGGAIRRPGTRFITAFSEQGRTGRFRFNRDQQYLLQWRGDYLDVYEDELKITEVDSPWNEDELSRLYAKAQLADTLVVFHDNHDDVKIPPYRFVRCALRSVDPLRFFADSSVVRVYHPAHNLLDGDKVGLSGITNEIALAEDPFEVTAAHELTMTLPADHDYEVGDYFFLSGVQSFGLINASVYLNHDKRHRVRTTGATWVTFSIHPEGDLHATGGGVSCIAYRKLIAGMNIETRINSAHTVIGIGSDLNDVPPLGEDPITVWSGDAEGHTLEIELGYDAGFYDPPDPDDATDPLVDYIKLSGLTGLSTIPAEQINATHRIVAVDGTKVYVVVANAGVVSTTGGGTGGSWLAASFYHIECADYADADFDGGGTNGRAWALVSLAPNPDRLVAFTHIPQYDFKDYQTPKPGREIQELIFLNMLANDEYDLLIEVPAQPGTRGATVTTPLIRYDDTKTVNAEKIQDAIASALLTHGAQPRVEGDEGSGLVTVEYIDVEGDEPGDHYVIKFEGSIDYAQIQGKVVHSNTGQIFAKTNTEGGTTEEDVISDTRGWPSGGIFYQRRLIMWGLASRPSTMIASKLEDFYNLDVGTALPGDAIDATGAFDPILHLVDARGLFMLTDGGEVLVSGGDGKSALQPDTIEFDNANTYGSTSAVPCTLAGRPVYIDRTGRAVRQLGYSQDTNNVESIDLSILSQSLLTSPQQLEVWRNDYGDYLFVRNEDGTFAVLNLNVEQKVIGWTNWSTDGEFVDVVTVNDTVYVTVKRSVGGEDVYYLEAFDFGYYSDSCVYHWAEDYVMDFLEFMTELRDDVPGYDHLVGCTVQVMGGYNTLEDAVVGAGGLIVPMSADAIYRSTIMEAGLAIPTPTLEPMPPQIGSFTSILSADVDLFESRDVLIGGFPVRPYPPGQGAGHANPPLITGLRSAVLRGWGERVSVVITAPHPQPCMVRGIQMEVA